MGHDNYQVDLFKEIQIKRTEVWFCNVTKAEKRGYKYCCKALCSLTTTQHYTLLFLQVF